MGWASGAELAHDVWVAAKKAGLPKEKQKKFARALIDIFENHDCDTMDECEDIIKAAGFTYNEDGERVEK